MLHPTKVQKRNFHILRSRTSAKIAGDRYKPAAVLVPIQERPDGDYLVLTQRAENLNSHSGHVAFPGGRVDACDSSPLDTALRESHEEIGLDPGKVRILGELDQVVAGSNYLVSPFVGIIPSSYPFTLNVAETRAVFTAPVSALMEPGCLSVGSAPISNKGVFYHFQYLDWDIWGATAKITKQLLELAYGFPKGDDL